MAAGYRYVIVGAGSAGCVLANRLPTPRAGLHCWKRAGPTASGEFRIPLAFITLFRSAYDWNYYTSKQPQLSDRELYWPRGKTLGGSSSINGMAWVRGHRADYDGWAQTAYHPVGTCRMGTDEGAVVDCELRVHGLDGLRVVDASVMPRITRGHPHAPTVMIAERAAELIRASNQESN